VPINGVNARAAADTEGALVEVVPAGAALVALARSADGQWIQVQLPSGDTAWVFRSVILPVGALDALPIAGPGETAPVEGTAAVTTTTVTTTTAPITTAPAVTATNTVTTTTPAAATPEAAPAAEATAGKLRVNVYEQPSSASERMASVGLNTVLPVTGRNAAGDWVQVVSSEDGAVGWVAAEDVELNVDIAALPVVP
jgi:hypothetical protein